MGNIFKAFLVMSLALVCVACDSGQSESELLQQGQEYLRQGELNSASIQFRNILQQNPQSAQARLALGQIYLAKGELAAAEKELVRAGELGIAPAEYLADLADVYLLQGKNDQLQALELEGTADNKVLGLVLAAKGVGNLQNGFSEPARVQIDEALSLNPDSPYVLVSKARLSAGLWEVEYAREEIGAVLEMAPNYAPAWSLLGDLERYSRDNEAAEAAYSKAIEYPWAASWQDRLKRAQVRVELGNLDGAQEDIDTITQRGLSSPDIFLAQGVIYLGRGSIEEASQAFGQALSNDPNGINALYYSALTNLRLGNLDIAEENAERCFSNAPESDAARKLLAAVRLSSGRVVAASELLAPIAGLDSNDADALSMMANALLKQDKKQEAIAVLGRTVELQPDSLEARLRLAVVLLEYDDGTQGVEELTQLLEENPESEQIYQMLVAYHLGRGNPNDALKVVQRLQATLSDSVVALQLLANVQIASGDQQAAIATLKELESIVPGDPGANFSLAEIAILNKDFAQARSYYARVLSKNPEHLPTLLRIVRLEAFEQRPEAMVSELQRAIAAHPSALEPRLMLARFYLAIGQQEKSLPLLNNLNTLDRNRIEVLELRGLVQLAQEDFQGATSTLDYLASQLPNSASAQYLLATAYKGLGNEKAELQQLQKAAGLDPGNFALGLNYARALVAADDLTGAGRELDRLEEIKPGSEAILRFRALIAHNKGSKEESAALLEQVFESDPSTVNLLTLVGQLWNTGDRESALALQEEWLSKNPADIAAGQALAAAYAIEGRTDEAAVGFEALLKKDPDNVVALNELAWLLKESQPGRALEYAERANALQPDSPALMDTLALSLYYNQKYQRARDVMRDALSQAPGHPALRYHEALIDVALGDNAKAIETLQSLVSDNTEFSEMQEAKALLAKLQP